jgi:hypothetical protein
MPPSEAHGRHVRPAGEPHRHGWVSRGGEARDIARTSIAGAFRDGKQLVLLGRGGEELAWET